MMAIHSYIHILPRKAFCQVLVIKDFPVLAVFPEPLRTIDVMYLPCSVCITTYSWLPTWIQKLAETKG